MPILRGSTILFLPFCSEWLQTPEQLHVAIVWIEQVIPAMRKSYAITRLSNGVIQVVAPGRSITLNRMKRRPVAIQYHARMTVNRIMSVLPYRDSAT